MSLRKWEDLPDFLRTPEIKPYYEVLKKKSGEVWYSREYLILLVLAILLIILSPIILILAIAIKLDSPIRYFTVRSELPSMVAALRSTSLEVCAMVRIRKVLWSQSEMMLV